MTKLDYAEILIGSPAWDGIRNPHKLVKMYSKQELKDAYNMLKEAEEDYYSSRYGN